MKKIIITIFIFISIAANARNIYVKAGGNDAYTGLSNAQAWGTITKVNSSFSHLAAGDSILFNRGDTFKGTITVGHSGSIGNPIVIGAYGTGEKPVISGFTIVSGWTNEGNGIYSKVISIESTPNMVTVNGVNTPKGRYPKTGWFNFESFAGTTSITDNQLTGTPNWTGGEVVIKKNNWTIDRSVITNHTNSTITYTSGSTVVPESIYDNYSYFLQNHRNALTQMGEWYSNGTNLYMYFGSNNPNSYIVKASVVDNVIVVSHKNAIIFQNLTIEGSNANGANIDWSENIQFKNCDFINNGVNAITAGISTSITVDSCSINNSNGSAINIHANNSVVKYCNINNTGLFPGMGPRDASSFYGISLRSDNGLIAYNTVTNTGYVPILFYNNNFKVRNNIVDGFCSLISDGAGIYTWTSISTPAFTGMEVYNNIVMNGKANGLYSDGVSNHVYFHDNTVFNMAKNGIHMNEPTYDIVSNNTFYNCNYGISIQNLYLNNIVAANNTVSDNIVAQDNNTQRMMTLTDGRTYQIGGFGTSDNNKYIVESANLNLFHTEVVLPSYTNKYYTLDNWRIFSGQEANSTMTTTNLSKIHFEYNDTQTPKIISLSNPMIDTYGTLYPESITLQPYTSAVLMAESEPDINNPPTIMNQSFQIDENSPNGTIVGTVVASDPDADQILQYSIVSKNTNGAFSINDSTGVISVANNSALNFDFALVVKVQDNSIGKLSSQATIAIHIIPTGIELTGNNETFKVYPNPISDELIIEIKENNDKLSFNILNSIGQIVFNGTLSERTIIQTANFSPGIYLIKIENGRSFEFKKIVKV